MVRDLKNRMSVAHLQSVIEGDGVHLVLQRETIT
jgi:hypothetical protein